MIKKVILLGSHIQALGIARMVNKLGLPVHLFIEYNLAIPRFSNTIKKVTIYSDGSDLIDKLLNLKDIDKDALIIATNDEQIEHLKNNYDELSNKFFLSIPQPQITDFCHNKVKTYKAASEAGIPIPSSFFPSSEADIINISKKIHYPVILKPALMYKFFKSTGKKVFVCNNFNELFIKYRKAIKIIPREEIIIQEFLTGGAKSLYSFGAFAVDGEILGGFMANRIRQKPMDFGISTCYAKSVAIKEIEDSAKKILKHINYFGFAEVEFMYDEKSKEYKLIEINPRTWKWHSIANILGIYLVELMIKYFNGEELIPKIVRVSNKAWIERIIDTYVVITEFFKGKLNLNDYFNSLKLEKEYAVWDKNDPLPAILYFILIPYLYFKRN